MTRSAQKVLVRTLKEVDRLGQERICEKIILKCTRENRFLGLNWIHISKKSYVTAFYKKLKEWGFVNDFAFHCKQLPAAAKTICISL